MFNNSPAFAAHARAHHVTNSYDRDRTNPEPSAPPFDGCDSPSGHNLKDDAHPQETKELTTSMSVN